MSAPRESATLQELGCCALCCLRFQSKRSREPYLAIPHEALTTENALRCVACLGILPQLATSSAWHERILAALALYEDAASFAVAFSFPVSTVLRQHLIAIDHADVVGVPFTDPLDIKEVARWLTAAALTPLTQCPIDHTSPALQIHVHIAHSETAAEHLFLQDIPQAQFSIRKVMEKGRAVIQGEGPAYVEQALKRVKASELKRRTDVPPNRIKEPAVLESVKHEHAPLYLGGRYCKYDRLTSQTRWITVGEFKVDQSVEQYIGQAATELCGASNYSFMGAGREDVDVRMLGRGRPFALTLTDPRRTRFSDKQLEALTARIAELSGGRVAVQDLRFVHRTALQILKDGETGKRKTYTCIVRANRPVTDEELASLSSRVDVAIAQETPVRVLHRRAPAVRPKMVHAMSAKRLSPTYFRLQLTTQAGTYVKEFVHGDLGRTQPTLGALIGTDCQTDILELDVIEVQLPWPPSTPADLPIQIDEAALRDGDGAGDDDD